MATVDRAAAPRLRPMAVHWLQATALDAQRVKRALLANIDGHRSVVELESFARAMGLDEDALRSLEAEGLIELQGERIDRG